MTEDTTSGGTPGGVTTDPDTGTTTDHTDSHGAQRRLYRHPDDRMIGGVAGGLGAYFDIDPVVFRILFVVLAFAGASGVLLYLVGWVVIPEAPGDGTADPASRAPRNRSGQVWVGTALIALALLFLIDDIGPFDDFAVWPVILIGLGVALLWRGREDTDSEDTAADSRPEAAPSPEQAAPSRPQASRSATAASAPSSSSAPSAPSTPPATRPGGAQPPRSDRPQARPPHGRSLLGRVTIGALLVVLGVTAMLDTLDVVAVAPLEYVAVTLAVLGLGLVVGAWWGRARWLVVPAVLLLPMLALASLAPFPLRGGVGERVHAPEAVSELEDSYELLAGDMRLDLSDIALDGRTVEVDVQVGFGQLDVVVPENAGVDITTDVRAGEVALFDRTENGLGVDLEVSEPGDTGRLVLDLDVGFGEIRVARAATNTGR